MAGCPKREDHDYNTGHFLMSVGGFKFVLDSFVLSHGGVRMKHVIWCTGQFSERMSSFVNVLCFFKEPFITLPHYIDCFLLKNPVMQLEKNVLGHLNNPCLIVIVSNM